MKGLNHENTHLFAIGNSGRQDDGLGWALAGAIEQRGFFKGKIHYRYQLQVEDAEVVAQAHTVIFVDAYKGILPQGFSWKPCEPAIEFHFSTHAIAPESILFLSKDLYGAEPQAFCLLIQGNAWELETGLTQGGQQHLEAAIFFFEDLIGKGQ